MIRLKAKICVYNTRDLNGLAKIHDWMINPLTTRVFTCTHVCHGRTYRLLRGDTNIALPRQLPRQRSFNPIFFLFNSKELQINS